MRPTAVILKSWHSCSPSSERDLRVFPQRPSSTRWSCGTRTRCCAWRRSLKLAGEWSGKTPTSSASRSDWRRPSTDRPSSSPYGSTAHFQCWGKLLLKVMRYNIALLPKKVTKYFLWKVMRYVTFALLSRYFLNMSRAWLFVFNTRSYIYGKYKSLSHQKV